jgi:putative glutamine amidotransferase
MNKPSIGIAVEGTMRCGPNSNALRRDCLNAVAVAGGAPIKLPNDIASIDVHAASIDGLVIGSCTCDPISSDEKNSLTKASATIREIVQDSYLRVLLGACMEKGVPILGVCGGMQLLVAWFGAEFRSLDLPRSESSPVVSSALGDAPSTRLIVIDEGTRLRNVLGTAFINVQGCDIHVRVDGNEYVRVSAVDAFGSSKAVEATYQQFCIGVHWHAGTFPYAPEMNLFFALVRAADSMRRNTIW